jgi:diguanylate cyclase (GGDEF)-like protein
MLTKDIISILLIDENPDDRFLIATSLTTKNRYSLALAENGVKALALFKEQIDYFQIVILGHQLSDMTGLEFMRRLQQINPVIPIIIIASGGSESVAVELMKVGAKDYVIKTGEYYKALHVKIDQVIEKQKFELLNNQFQRRLEKRANKDFLTGLLKRYRFTELLEHELATAERYHCPFATAKIDVDKFKLINDQFGHKMGDYALVIIADILKSQLRTLDVIGRFGGDEFLIAMPETDHHQALPTFNPITEVLHQLILKNNFLLPFR